LIAYQNELLSLSFGDSWKEKYIFNLVPKLFLPVKLMNESVSLHIEGIDIKEKIQIAKPFPNKRYFVAGCKVNNLQFSGFYPIIGDKDNFPKTLKLALHWYINNKLRIVHRINLIFDLTEGNGFLFSTCQEFTRSVNLNSVDLATYMGEDEELWMFHNVNFGYSRGGKQYIYEEATLQNYPFEIHHGHYFADKYFLKWRDQYRREM